MVMSSSWPKACAAWSACSALGRLAASEARRWKLKISPLGMWAIDHAGSTFRCGRSGAKSCERKVYALARALMSLISRMGVG